MTAGRPTKLTPALIAKAKKYDYKAAHEAVPTIEGLSLHLGVSRKSLYNWMEEDGDLAEQFLHIASGLLRNY